MIPFLSPSAKLSPLIHVQGDFVTYGLNGFSHYPRGFGLDIAYLNKSDFAGALKRGKALGYILSEAERTVKSGIASDFFVSSFVGRIQHIALYEWHYEKSRIVFEYCKSTFPQFRHYQDFEQFAKECLGAVHARTPMELEAIVREKTNAFLKGKMDSVAEAQPYLLRRHAEDVLKRVFIEMLGGNDGLALFRMALEEAGDAELTLHPDKFRRSYFMSKRFGELLKNWHWQAIQAWITPEKIKEELKLLRWPEAKKTRARNDTLATLDELPKPLLELLYRLQIPLFVATDNNANFFRFFHSGLPLSVVKGETELQEHTMNGLCSYRPFYRGAIIVTHGGMRKERFFHVVMEECTHFSDGPRDRWAFIGGHRYSSTREFDAAYRADRSKIPAWDRTGVLGAKEWGQTLTSLRVNPITRTRAQKAIETYEATLAFDHYPADERAAEIFAALPIIQRAIGRRLARKVLPNLFGYYDRVYVSGLAEECRSFRDA